MDRASSAHPKNATERHQPIRARKLRTTGAAPSRSWSSIASAGTTLTSPAASGSVPVATAVVCSKTFSAVVRGRRTKVAGNALKRPNLVESRAPRIHDEVSTRCRSEVTKDERTLASLPAMTSSRSTQTASPGTCWCSRAVSRRRALRRVLVPSIAATAHACHLAPRLPLHWPENVS